MSVVRKIPYIESTLARLTDTQLGLLSDALNSNDAPERYSLIDADSFIPALTGGDIIAPVKLVLEKGKPAYNGFLVHVTDKDSEALTLFIGYHRFQDLMLVEIDNESKSFERINEYCDINELRRVLNDLGGSGTGGLTPTGLLGLLDVENSGLSADVSLDGTKMELHLDQDTMDAVFLKEATATVSEDGVISFSLDEYSADEKNQVLFEVEGTGSHFGGSLIVFPKDADICVTAGVLLYNSEYIHYHMTNNDGLVAITFESQVVATTDTVKVHYRTLK